MPLRVIRHRASGHYYRADGEWTGDLNLATRFTTLTEAKETAEALARHDCSAVLKVGDEFEAIVLVE